MQTNTPTPLENYQQLMNVVRSRLDAVQSLSKLTIDEFNNSEIAAFHGRKIIEAIAFGCLVGIKNGLKTIPRDAEGQYNAEKIFKNLNSKGIDIFPSPSKIRYATESEINEHNTKIVVEGIPERRIDKNEMIKKYQRMHNWLHELNPYTKDNQEVFYQKNKQQLWKDLNELELFLSSHVMSINGEAFFCVLRDKQDGRTKVISLSKISDI